MTDKEIIKALECCKYEYDTKCELCCYNFYSRTGCRSELRRNALDLINRLQAEKKELVGNIDRLKTELFDKTEQLKTAKAEIERLKPFEDKIAEFKSHIRVEDMLVFASSLEEWLEFCDNLKAEAYKECIEKVKEISKYETYCDNRLSAPIITYHITEDKLDNLSKELVGDKND